MIDKSFLISEAMRGYIESNWMREPAVLRELREETKALPNAGFQISPDQGQWISFLVALMGAKRVLEIGVYTGYSSICAALSLPPAARLVACDVSDEYTQVARGYWQKAGVADRITLKLAPARETLATLEPGFDAVFIDADKPGYPHYVEEAHRLLRAGGLMMIDNVFWHGQVADSADQSPETNIIRNLNSDLHVDPRWDLTVLPMGDGITLARKRG